MNVVQQSKLAILILCACIGLFGVTTFAAENTLLFKILGTTQCVDGIDNDADGYTDYPSDPDCGSYDDDDEEGFQTQVIGGGGGGGAVSASTRIFISGKAFPGGTVTVLQNGVIVEEVSVGLVGTFDIRLSDLQSGPSIFMIVAKDVAGRQAVPVTTAVFLAEGVITQLSGIEFTSINTPATLSSCPVLADFNNDCAVDIRDMSIAAFWWNRELSSAFAAVERAKLNGDGKITIEDFSLIAFYWTG